MDVSVSAVVWLQGDIHEKSPGTVPRWTLQAPMNPLQQSISALNNIRKCEIRVLPKPYQNFGITIPNALCSTHTCLCFVDRSYTSQNTVAAMVYVYVSAYGVFREETKPKIEKWGCHCNLPCWKKVSLGCAVVTPHPCLDQKLSNCTQ